MQTHSNSKYLLGLDLGTSSLKAILLNRSGTPLATAGRSYPLDTPQEGWVEQDPQTWVQAAVECIAEVLQQSQIPPHQVAAIGLAGQMHSLVCLDERGQVLRPAIIWADQRSGQQVGQVMDRIGREQLAQWTANPLATGFMLASWLWIREQEPHIAQRTRWLLLPKDYLRYRLTGGLAAEPSDASSTLLFDSPRREWSQPLLSALAIDPAILPAIRPSTAIAGGLLPELAAACGLPAGLPVVCGGSDQAVQALAHGVIDPGLASCTIGTGGQWLVPTPLPVVDPELRLHLFYHVLPDRWHLEAAILTAGLSLRWLRDNVLQGSSYQELADLAEKAPPGAEGLIFYPYLAGERTPYMDPNLRAGFMGLGLNHRKEHLIRAVMEGVIFAMRQGLELMTGLGVSVERVVASGGTVRHPLWLQLEADIFGQPIYQTETIEAAATGAALLAGLGVGVYPGVADAIRETVRWKSQVIEPNPDHTEVYDQTYQRYVQIYPALKQSGMIATR